MSPREFERYYIQHVRVSPMIDWRRPPATRLIQIEMAPAATTMCRCVAVVTFTESA